MQTGRGYIHQMHKRAAAPALGRSRGLYKQGYTVDLVIHVRALVHKSVGTGHIAMICRKDDGCLLIQTQFLERCHQFSYHQVD